MSRVISEGGQTKEILATIKEEFPRQRTIKIDLVDGDGYFTETHNLYVGKNYIWLRTDGWKIFIPYESIVAVRLKNKTRE